MRTIHVGFDLRRTPILTGLFIYSNDLTKLFPNYSIAAESRFLIHGNGRLYYDDLEGLRFIASHARAGSNLLISELMLISDWLMHERYEEWKVVWLEARAEIVYLLVIKMAKKFAMYESQAASGHYRLN